MAAETVASHVAPAPTPHSGPPLHTSNRQPPTHGPGGAGSPHEALLVLVPAALVAVVVLAVFGAYKWRRWTEGGGGGGRGEEGLCWAWRQRFRRRSSPRRPAAVGGCITTHGGDCTAMLVEELTDIDADVWDAHLEEEDSRPENTTQQLTTNSSSSSSENADSDTYICTVEVHSDPYLKEADDPIPDQTIQSQGSDRVSLNQTTDEDVSTQALDISQSNITTPSYYSAQSSSAPSITTLHSPDDTPPTSSVSSPASRGELAQEIVNMVQSEDFAEDAGSAVLRCGSSQLCLFSSAANNSRGCLGDTEQCTPIRMGGFTSSTPASSVRVGQDGRERIVIPLSELDNYFGWEEDWDQELQTML